MIVKFRGWPRDMVMQMHLWHIGVAEPPCEGHPLPRQMARALSMPYRRGQPRKHMTWQENIGLTQYRCCQVVRYGGTHSAALRSSLLPFPASSLPQTVRKVLARLKYPVPLYKDRSGFSILTEECLTFRTTSRENLSPAGTSHLPLPEAVGWPRPPYRIT